MKLLQKFSTWLLTCFNVGVYNLSDSIDTLVHQLRLLGLKDYANTIIQLSQDIEHQQGIIIMLDTIKCLLMVLSLVLLYLTNQHLICKSILQIKNKFQQFYSYCKQLFKPKSHPWK